MLLGYIKLQRKIIPDKTTEFKYIMWRISSNKLSWMDNDVEKYKIDLTFNILFGIIILSCMDYNFFLLLDCGASSYRKH